MTEERKPIATRDAYGKALLEMGKQNSNIVVLDADLSKSTKTALFKSEFPERFFNMGIAEQGMMDVAGGLAASGKIPFVSTFAIFATGRAWEQARLACGYNHLNIKICATHAGITVGEDGATHQANEDIALMREIPGMTVVVPADGVETASVIKTAVEYEGPMYVRLGRSAVPVLLPDDYKYEIGKAVTLQEGSDVSLFACGIMVGEALQAAETLKAEGISAEVVNVSTIKPLDVETILKSACKTKAVVTAEEHSILGGLGSAVAETLVENCPVPMKRVGMNDSFGESGKPAELLEKYGMTAADIVAAAKEVIKRKGCCSC